jgi:hypothetical protein
MGSVTSGAINGVNVYAHYWAVQTNGSDALLALTPLFGLGLLASILAIIASVVGLCFRKTRALSLGAIVFSCCYMAVANQCMSLGWDFRRAGFEAVADRSHSLVAAIHRFEMTHGRPPDSLEALVPEYLDTVPVTGLAAYPKYQYARTSDSDSQIYLGNPWRLSIQTGYSLGFDQFLFLPLLNYPTHGYGGWLERIGDWAYVHE